mmetsp:Transcript_11622/g.9669  ORF Transcript_11622/g.9669 Transcript_11622/m.9669 type:complete len:125 (+) Transcript_11622:117-491(+)
MCYSIILSFVASAGPGFHDQLDRHDITGSQGAQMVTCLYYYWVHVGHFGAGCNYQVVGEHYGWQEQCSSEDYCRDCYQVKPLEGSITEILGHKKHVKMACKGEYKHREHSQHPQGIAGRPEGMS